MTIWDLQGIMRHRHFGTTEKYYLKQNAADQAQRIAEKLGYATAKSTQLSETGETTEVVER